MFGRRRSTPPRPPTLPLRLATNIPVALLLSVVLALQLGILSTVTVPTTNMVPSLEVDDHLLVRSFGPGPVRGDVVVYRSPFDIDHLQIGRVVGLAGDRIELDDRGLLVNGQPLTAPAPAACGDGSDAAPDCEDPPCRQDPCSVAAESAGDRRYFTRSAAGLSMLQFGPVDVPEHHVFVLSDNRVDRRDSRIFGAIPHSAIVGVASFVYYAQDESGIRWDRIRRGVS